MFARSAVWLPILLAACKSEQVIANQEARLAFSPELVDLGDVAVGTVASGEIYVDQLEGPTGVLRTVTVQNLDGSTAFSYEGPDRIEVPRGERVTVPVTFAPEEEGWFSARVSIVHNGLDSPASIDVRGHGVPPDASLTPSVLDFGAVASGARELADLTLANPSAVDLTVEGLAFSSDVFSTAQAVPFTVAAGEDVRIEVAFAPTDDLPASGELTVRFGTAERTSLLRGNDCEDGDPAAYDVDADGVTSCGGDCDDDRAEVRPGLPELDDGLDNDCDQIVDEGTADYDDDGDGLTELEGDCDDADAAVAPGAAEVASNGVDDDCDGVVDAGTTDADLDGYDPVVGGDCDDADPTVHPGAVEVVDGVDNDCDNGVDEGTVAHDDDGDGFCELAVGCTDGATGGDCDDTDAASRPGAGELPDRRDNDCDGLIDEGTAAYDDDGDGYTEQGGDCDDGDPALSPGLGTCP